MEDNKVNRRSQVSMVGSFELLLVGCLCTRRSLPSTPFLRRRSNLIRTPVFLTWIVVFTTTARRDGSKSMEKTSNIVRFTIRFPSSPSVSILLHKFSPLEEFWLTFSSLTTIKKGKQTFQFITLKRDSKTIKDLS